MRMAGFLTRCYLCLGLGALAGWTGSRISLWLDGTANSSDAAGVAALCAMAGAFLGLALEFRRRQAAGVGLGLLLYLGAPVLAFSQMLATYCRLSPALVGTVAVLTIVHLAIYGAWTQSR